LEAPHRAAISPTRLLWASRDAGGPPPLRWRRRHPFPRPTFSPPRQRGCTCPRARSRLWSRPACPVSMRRRARHRPEGQGIARTCLEFTSRWSCGAEARQFMAIRTRCGSAVVRTASRGRVYRIYHIEALSQTVKFERNCHLAEPPSDASLGGVIRTHRAIEADSDDSPIRPYNS